MPSTRVVLEVERIGMIRNQYRSGFGRRWFSESEINPTPGARRPIDS